MKALGLLEIYKNLLLDGTTLMESDIDEAIKELEELENRSCDNCKYFHQSYLCLELGKGNIQPKEIGLNYCNKWEAKNENL